MKQVLAIAAAALLAAAASFLAAGARAALPGGTGWAKTAHDLRGLNGQQFDFLCPAGGQPGPIWGTDVYTDDSSICTAAVHAGKITVDAGGRVTIEIRPGQASYQGSTRNGIESSSYGKWDGSYVVVAAAAPGAANPGGTGWTVDPSDYRGQDGTRYVFACPANGKPSSVWGTGVYTDDSSVCNAAVLEGKLKFSTGGTVTVEIRPGQASYTGSEANGVRSSDYGSWTGSFVIVDATAAAGPPGIGGTGWDADAEQFRGRNGDRYAFTCPAGGRPGTVYGTDTYTDDTSVCSAGVHAGVITAAAGGTVTIEIRPGQASYQGTTRNGITSRDYGKWDGSYVVVGARGGGGGTPAGGGATIGQPGPLPAPKPGVAVNVQSAGGTILVKLPGRATFAKLVGGAQVPVGAQVDVTKGAINLTSGEGTAKFNGGVFKVSEPRVGGVRVTNLALQGGNFAPCPKKGKYKSVGAKPATIIRKLFGNGKGNFRTTGRFASATIRGTRWLFEDRCDGTWIRVFSGKVAINDFTEHKVVVIAAGKTYIAKRR